MGMGLKYKIQFINWLINIIEEFHIFLLKRKVKIQSNCKHEWIKYGWNGHKDIYKCLKCNLETTDYAQTRNN